MPPAASEDEVEGLDEEFLYHLSRGSDLLSKGEAEPARASLERALELRAKDPKVLGLLGQAYYRLGLFERAAEVYARLVDDNPVEPGARVNLGLANLKAKHYDEAVKQLSIAVDLQPGHKKAMGYLGLALLESGEVATARDWFARAGSEAGVARCDEMLAAGSSAGAPVPASREASRAPLPEEITTPLEAGPASPEPRPGRSGLAAEPTSRAYPGLAGYAAARLVVPGPEAPFSVEGRTLTIAVRGELMTRIDGLYAARGALEMLPAVKQFRGRATDTAFGEGARRMHRVRGEGVLLYLAEGRRFTALDLGSEASYFREEMVFALEDSVTFENGRVTAKGAPDLNLVHLRGRGRFLLVTQGEPAALEVAARQPLRVPLEALVGWLGGLTPRVVALSEAGVDAGEPAGAVVVELIGEGRALVDPAAARERGSSA